jgi:beta-glucanase (GH16 family)
MRLSLLVIGIIAAATYLHAVEWQLAWSDEFDYSGLPDSTKWDYEEGFVRNAEMQYYTRERLENARVENGVLVIEGRKEQIGNPKYKPGSDSWILKRQFGYYTSASLITLNKASWTYGRIEVRARLPHGKGTWPAIWTLGANRTKVKWPTCGEIDIMEFVGKEPDWIHGNIHYIENGKHRSNGGKIHTEKPYADFHIYAIEWFPDRVDFFFDDTKYHTFPIDNAGIGEDNPFRKPHYLLINLALGGSWGGEIDESILPQKYLIDYVRVYQAKN